MASRPTTDPDSWVPAGAERGETMKASQPVTAQAPRTAPTPPAPRAPARTPEEGPARRRPLVALPPPAEPRRPPRLKRARARAASIVWVAVAIAVPWAWYLVRDLGPAMQFVSMALPVLVAASLLGLLIAAADARKVTPLLVAASVAAFGWASVIGPRGAQPSPKPVDPVRIAAVTLPETGVGGQTMLKAVEAPKADVEVVVAPTKKAGAALARSSGRSGGFQSGRFVVISRLPTQQLTVPKGLPSDLVIRFQVSGPHGPFVVYAVRSGAGVIESTLNDPIGIDRLRSAALGERLPVVLVGDAGISDRSTGYRSLTLAFRDAMRAGRSASSTLGSFWMPLLLRVDHVFTSTTWCATGGSTFTVPGSDHVGVAASVGACPR